jgi:DNA-binding transcriptional ArsR family regulator
MSVLESEVSKLYEVLGHPMRRQLIRLLGEAKRASFTDLKSKLKVSVGTLYYNLDLLEDLVAQDKEKKYVLTPKGEMAYRLLVESEEKLASLGLGAERQAGWFRALSKAFTVRGLFSYLYASPKLSLPSAITILIYGVWVNYQAQLLPLILLYSDKPILPPLWASSLFISGWMIINIFGNLVPSIFYRRPVGGGVDSLLVGSCYAILPSLVLPTIWVICKVFLIPLSLIAAQLIMLLAMGYSLCLLTTAISMAKGLRMEKAALVTMTIFYLTVGLALFSRF